MALPEIINFNGQQITRDAFMMMRCYTKEDLHNWIKLFVNIDFPDCTVSEGSNANPMDMIWWVYKKCVIDKDVMGSRAVFCASRGSFKCVEKNTTYLLASNGPKLARDVQVGDIIFTGKSWQPVVNVFNEGVIPSVSVKLTNYHTLTGSVKHRVVSLDSEGNLIWKKLLNFNTNDYVLLTLPPVIKFNIAKEDYDWGYLLGLLMGDGCLSFINTIRPKTNKSSAGHHRQVTWTCASPTVVKWMSEYLTLQGARLVDKKSTKNKYDYYVRGRDLLIKLEQWLDCRGSLLRRVTPQIFKSSPSLKLGFLSGYYDADGTFSNKDGMLYCSSNYGLMTDTQSILFSLGIYSKIISFNYTYKDQIGTAYRLIISYDEVDKLLPLGFQSNYVESPRHQQLYNKSPKQFYFNRMIPAKLIEKAFRDDRARLKLKLVELRGGVNMKGESVGARNVKHLPALRWSAHSWRSYQKLSYYKLNGFVTYASQYIEVSPLLKLLSLPNVRVEKIKENPVIHQADCVDFEIANEHQYWSNGMVSHNTLGLSIAELLSIIHGDRDVAHIGAIETQATRCYSYFTKYMWQEEFKHFIDDDPTMKKTKFKTGRTVEIIPCSIAQVNGPHTSLVCLDEIDTVRDMQAYRDVSGIPSPTMDGRPPVEVSISTRKSVYGLMQQEMESAHKTNTDVFIWNIIDITKQCPDSRSLTERVDIYVNFDTLEAIDEATFDNRPITEKINFEKRLGYKGCLSNCKMYAACLGCLKNQKSTSKLLRDIEYTQADIFKRSLDYTIAQLLCRKPSTEGTIYSTYSYKQNVKTYNEIYEIFMGEAPTKQITFEDMHFEFTKRGIYPYIGVDPGDQLAAAILVYIDGARRVYVLKEQTFTATDDNELALWIKHNWGNLGVQMIYSDSANPSAMRLLIKQDLPVSQRVVKDVHAGVTTVRSFLRIPGTNRTRLFIHENCSNLIFEFPRYHFKKTANDMISGEPNKQDDHSLDPLRYVLHSIFGGQDLNVTSVIPPGSVKTEPGETVLRTTEGNYTRAPSAKELAENIGIPNFVDNTGDVIIQDEDPSKKPLKGTGWDVDWG